MDYFVYIAECLKDGEFSCYYTGQTNNIDRRKKEHIENVINHDTRKFTGRFDYVKLLWYRKVPTRGDALRLEKYLKSLNPDEKEDYMEENGTFW